MSAAGNARKALFSAVPTAGSAIEASLALQMRAERLTLPTPQFQPFPERRFRVDFAWPDRRVIVEVDGEVHRIKARFHADIEKHALLVLAGWTVLRVGGREVRSGQAVQWVRQVLDAHPSPVFGRAFEAEVQRLHAGGVLRA